MNRRSLTVLRRPVWVAGALIAALAAAGFLRLGFWQLDRHQERRAANAELVAALAADPVSFGQAPGAADPAEFQRVVLAGRYTGDQVLLQNRSRSGSAGFHVLAVIEPDAGPGVVVDRGWVPLAVLDDPGAIPAPPPGPVEVTGFLRMGAEGAITTGADGRIPAKVTRVDVAAIEGLVGRDLADDHVQLQAQDPAVGADDPLPAAAPGPDAGPHLGYALQWFAFAAIVVIGFPVLVGRTGRTGVSRDGAPGRPPPPPGP